MMRDELEALPPTVLLTLAGVSTGYGASPVLDKVDLTIRAGEIVTVIGRSGVGKTTLLRLLLGRLPVTHGTLTRDPVLEHPGAVACVFQSYRLIPHLSALRNVMLVLRRNQPLWRRLLPDHVAERHARDILTEVNLGDDKVGLLPHELSGGQRQRVAIAQAIAQGAGLLLLDEPFGALDEETREDLQLRLFRLTRDKKMAVLLITHDLEEALFLGDRVCVLSPATAGAVLSTTSVERLRGELDPAIKDNPEFFRSAAILRHRLIQRGDDDAETVRRRLEQPLDTGFIDEDRFAELERAATEILVITPDLQQDVDNAQIASAVRENLAAGKRYWYVVPKDDAAVAECVARYKDMYGEHRDRWHFHETDTPEWLFLFGEMVIHNPRAEKSYGFMYLHGGARGRMLRIPDPLLVLIRKNLEKWGIKNER